MDGAKLYAASTRTLHDFPVLAAYQKFIEGHTFIVNFIGPRTPIASRGETVVFNLPQVGDAEAYATEVTGKASNIDAAIGVLTTLYQDPEATIDCSERPENGSKIFLQEVYCRALVKSLS